MKKKYLFGIVAALALIATAVYSVDNKKIEYMNFRDAEASGRRAQVAGTWVKEMGCRYDTRTDEFHFTMKDDKGTALPVVLHGPKPNNFELATSVVATGSVENGHFEASDLLTKCPSKYEA